MAQCQPCATRKRNKRSSRLSTHLASICTRVRETSAMCSCANSPSFFHALIFLTLKMMRAMVKMRNQFMRNSTKLMYATVPKCFVSLVCREAAETTRRQTSKATRWFRWLCCCLWCSTARRLHGHILLCHIVCGSGAIGWVAINPVLILGLQ